jgi:thiosulfate/3-mercaptopyruvate sulfurtransferase
MNRRERVLVDGEWLAGRLHDPTVVLLEVDERPLIYRAGHIPGAHCVNWHTELQDPINRDIPDGPAIQALWTRLGITSDTTVVFYGDKNNWYAAFAFWVFRLYGLEDLRLLDGGRQAWISEGRPTDRERPSQPPRLSSVIAVPALDPRFRADLAAVRHALEVGEQLLDVRTAAEYRGDLITLPGWPGEGAQRGGHIPGAHHVPWEISIGFDGKLLPEDELRDRLDASGVDLDRPAITYCRIGERSAHTWFVLSEILGIEARNYDGSWAEWGSMIGTTPVAVGDLP